MMDSVVVWMEVGQSRMLNARKGGCRNGTKMKVRVRRCLSGGRANGEVKGAGHMHLTTSATRTLRFLRKVQHVIELRRGR